MPPVHLFFYAINEFYGLMGSNNILCDNKGYLYTSEWKFKQIPAGAKNNVVQWVLRHVKNKMKSLHLLHYVKAYQDDYKIAPTSP